MEVFRYITEKNFGEIKSSGMLVPRNADGLIYAIPEDHAVWDEEATKMLFDFIHAISGAREILLVNFMVDNLDPQAWSQEGANPPWAKYHTKKPLRLYQRSDYQCPEVIIAHPIPKTEIALVKKIPLSSDS